LNGIFKENDFSKQYLPKNSVCPYFYVQFSAENSWVISAGKKRFLLLDKNVAVDVTFELVQI
jgi:hypothetical protein